MAFHGIMVDHVFFFGRIFSESGQQPLQARDGCFVSDVDMLVVSSVRFSFRQTLPGYGGVGRVRSSSFPWTGKWYVLAENRRQTKKIINVYAASSFGCVDYDHSPVYTGAINSSTARWSFPGDLMCNNATFLTLCRMYK